MVTTLTTCGVNESGALLKESMSIRPEAIGKIIMFAGSTAPEGTLYCNGAAISRTTYSELFAAIGTTYGAGDGSTTFNLPDLRGKWAMGADGSRITGTAIAEALPNVSGFIPTTNILTASRRWEQHPDEESWIEQGGMFKTTFAARHTIATQGEDTYDQIFSVGFDGTYDSNIYGASQHVQPASVALLPCIIYE